LEGAEDNKVIMYQRLGWAADARSFGPPGRTIEPHCRRAISVAPTSRDNV
jgi:hypothetical protein